MPLHNYYFTAGIDCRVLMPELGKINFPFYAVIDSNPDETYVHEVIVDEDELIKVCDVINATISEFTIVWMLCQYLATIMNQFGDFDHVLDAWKQDREERR